MPLGSIILFFLGLLKMIAKFIKDLSRITIRLTTLSTIAIVLAIAESLIARPSFSAEAVRFYIGSPVTVSLSLDSLETFAETGEITGDLKLFTLFLDDQLMAQLRQGLQQRFPMTVVQGYNMSYSPLGRDAIAEVGKIVRYSPNRNGFYGISRSSN